MDNFIQLNEIKMQDKPFETSGSSSLGRFRTLRSQTLVPSSLALGSVALGLSTAMLMPSGAAAQTASVPASAASAAQPAARAPRTIVLNEVTVKARKIDPNPNAEVGAPYKAKTSGDSR
jgi:hypothetical protein